MGMVNGNIGLGQAYGIVPAYGAQQNPNDWQQFAQIYQRQADGSVSQLFGNNSTVGSLQGVQVASGNKPIVVCNGQVTECKTIEEAQSKAEELAHQHSADAFILKPFRKVAPKRDVVTTDL